MATDVAVVQNVTRTERSEHFIDELGLPTEVPEASNVCS
jgi:hypothetical protein